MQEAEVMQEAEADVPGSRNRGVRKKARYAAAAVICLQLSHCYMNVEYGHRDEGKTFMLLKYKP